MSFWWIWRYDRAKFCRAWALGGQSSRDEHLLANCTKHNLHAHGWSQIHTIHCGTFSNSKSLYYSTNGSHWAYFWLFTLIAVCKIDEETANLFVVPAIAAGIAKMLCKHCIKMLVNIFSRQCLEYNTDIEKFDHSPANNKWKLNLRGQVEVQRSRISNTEINRSTCWCQLRRPELQVMGHDWRIFFRIDDMVSTPSSRRH